MAELRIRTFESRDLPAVLDMWNGTARGRTLYHPLTERKARILLFDKPGFDPGGFFLAEDGRGIAGGLSVGVAPKGERGVLNLVFSRSGRLSDPAADRLIERALGWLAEKGCRSVATNNLSDVDSRDLETLEFLWRHRFVIPAVHDPLIARDIGSAGTFLGRDLEDFAVPDEVRALKASLGKDGVSFRAVVSDKDGVKPESFEEFPFAARFKEVCGLNSPLEHLFLAFRDGRVVGGAMVSLPGAPTDWSYYGCDCGLFGPTGVLRTLRGGGVGKVLLFESVARLRELNCASALIPTNATTFPFYAKAGFRIVRVNVHMERTLEPIVVKFKEIL